MKTKIEIINITLSKTNYNNNWCINNNW